MNIAKVGYQVQKPWVGVCGIPQNGYYGGNLASQSEAGVDCTTERVDQSGVER